MIRIAAVGDVHYDKNPREKFRQQFEVLSDRADLLLIAGDLTQSGALEEAQALAYDLKSVKVPVIMVLGNHDYHQDRQDEMQDLFRNEGLIVLEGNSVTFDIRGQSVGVMGLKGFGGGFFGACITEFGEPEIKAFARHAKIQAEILKTGLDQLNTDFVFALLHYSPIEATLLGEKREIYPFLGSFLLAEAIDSVRVDAAFHGHAHFGTERGMTPGGVPIRNVALNVIRHTYHVYSFEQPSTHKEHELASQNLSLT